MEVLTGSVEHITYYNPENGYSVVRLQPDQRRLPNLGRDGLATITGNLPELAPGEYLRLQGNWTNHPKHGMQFQVELCEQTLPATTAGIRRYLGSGLIRGIGPRLAERIVAHFGAKTLEAIEEHPELLREVPDIGPKRSLLIAQAWEEQKQVKEIMLFLHSHGISTNLAVKIYKHYGDQALQVVRSDPYRLARDIYGIGFKTADRIAQSLGLPADHPSRIEAGVVYVLNEMSNEGHVYAPQPELAGRAAELLKAPPELIQPALQRLAEADRIRTDQLPGSPLPPITAAARESSPAYPQTPAIYLTPFFLSETSLAQRLAALAAHIPSRLSDMPPAFTPLHGQLSEEQQAAIRSALSHPVSVLTGGPGTGKTTAIQALIAALEAAHKRYALASPTGRAAKRLAEATGRPASTIHRLLGVSPAEGFKHNTENPLPIDLLVVDEASMLDLMLAHHLLKAIPPGAHLLLVGDVDQLPSVGAGDVLRDVIASGVAPVTRLSAIFRQAAGSHIITNAHRINQGQLPDFPSTVENPANGQMADFFLFSAESAEQAADWVEQVVCQRIPARFGLHPRDQVQVLSPMYRGPAGVSALNARLQAVLNPPAAATGSHPTPEKSLFGQTFRPGDKVMQLQNNYDKEVFNGDIGLVAGLDLVEHTLTIDFDKRLVVYDWNEADQISLAYAVSVHKAQGSEFPAVVIPLVTAHYMMLQRNLLYTAITRAKKLCVLVGSRKAIAMAVKNNEITQRYTALDWRLREHYR
ncbi:MAG TPA: ATP-dependent RecD-like DNA helicase [Anaerolineales bacterium]|nr:ATP-dependent RecD-like DNA helicase [Anaerolineales bacterium]